MKVQYVIVTAGAVHHLPGWSPAPDPPGVRGRIRWQPHPGKEKDHGVWLHALYVFLLSCVLIKGSEMYV